MDSPSRYYKKEVARFLNDVVPQRRKKNYYVYNHTFSYEDDVQEIVDKLYKKISTNDRVVVISFNYLWKPLLNLAIFLGLRKRDAKEPNWLDKNDIKNIFHLSGLEEIKSGNRFILPLNLGWLSTIVNRYFSQLPFVNMFCLTTFQIFRRPPERKNYSVSIIVPARNEEGNIKGILRKIPNLSPKMEVIFVEGHSKDRTRKAIQEEIKNYRGKIRAKLLGQTGIGKADAVRMGFQKAKNDLLIVLDADLSVNPKDLKKFYNAVCSGKCELANGSRMVYPFEGKAMATLNIIGNKIFSLTFSYLLGQSIKDTLCGTKAILKKHYQQIVKNRNFFGNFDPFGDYDLIFGASKLNLKIADIPVRYHQRTYGATNISRFRHGLLLLKMTIVAASKLKFR